VPDEGASSKAAADVAIFSSCSRLARLAMIAANISTASLLGCIGNELF
jgi:hypothetical protein